MRVSSRSLTVPLATPFSYARAVEEEVSLVEVAVSLGDVTGYGEAAPQEYDGETAETVSAFVERAAPLLGDDPFAVAGVERRLDELPRETAARAAVEAALHDLAGKLSGLPTWRLLGLDRAGPPTAYSIWLGDPDEMGERARAAGERFRVLKIKVGAADGRDVERVRAVRAASDCPLLVDANEGWTLEEALETLPALAELGVALVEQPLRAGDPDAPRLKRASPVPVYLDEECHTLAEVAAAAERAHGINVKLAKAGGIREAVRMVHAARALGLGAMLGCMVESSLGIAAACQVASLFDYVDLDGNLLLADDPWTGVELRDGVQLPPAAPGLGVHPSAAAAAPASA